MTRRDQWHVFHGWVVRCGVRVGDLTAAEFLDLVHHYILMSAEPEQHDRLNRLLTGPPTVNRPTLVDERAGFTPPSWWRGDEAASRAGMAAMVTMRR